MIQLHQNFVKTESVLTTQIFCTIVKLQKSIHRRVSTIIKNKQQSI